MEQFVHCKTHEHDKSPLAHMKENSKSRKFKNWQTRGKFWISLIKRIYYTEILVSSFVNLMKSISSNFNIIHINCYFIAEIWSLLFSTRPTKVRVCWWYSVIYSSLSIPDQRKVFISLLVRETHDIMRPHGHLESVDLKCCTVHDLTKSLLQ